MSPARHIRTLLSHLTPPNRTQAPPAALLSASDHDVTVHKARADVIDTRARMTAALLSILTLAWIAVDALAFDWPLWGVLALGRTVASICFAVCVLTGQAQGELARARLKLAALFAIPTAFFLFANFAIGALPESGRTLPVLTAYVHLPFLLVAGLAIFPLTALESAGLALFVLVATVLALLPEWGLAASAFGWVELWLMSLIGAIGTIAGMSQLRYLVVLTEQSSRDALTGLLNRRVGEEMLDLEFEISRRAGAPLCVLFLDLDGFKPVNDRFGHDAGDTVLRNTATALVGTVRHQDMVVRWGGEEFLVVLPNTDEAGARRMLWRLAMAGLGEVPDGTRQTASIGIAERRRDGAVSWARLVEIADARMYEAKRAGGNRCAGAGGAVFPFLPGQASSRQPEARRARTARRERPAGRRPPAAASTPPGLAAR